MWLLVLAAYIFVGIASVPFHGDEAMQITMSRDYDTAFINHDFQALRVNPPYTVDSANWLRLINGSINLYTVGLSLQVAGYGEKDLPPVWIWPLSYNENVARGNRPTERMLIASRISSAVFLALSAAILFGIGWQLRGRWAGYTASGLYALNPVVLLNGRRAMMEGSVLCFGLLAILVAIVICKGRNGWRWWVALGIVSGLTLVSKHSGIVFVAAAFGWVVIRQMQIRLEPQRPGDNTKINHRGTESAEKNQTLIYDLIHVGVSILIMVGVFIALSPAQWNDPVARFGDLVSERAKLLESQVKAEPTAPTPLSERVAGIFTQPYVQAPVYFEAAFWGGAKAIQDEIAVYNGSIWSGLHAGTVIGSLLTLLALVGVVILLKAWRTWEIGVLVWLVVTVASLLVNPLPWQRYYLALYPLATLLAAIGVVAIIGWLNQRRSST
ncbi:MAG: glycosyltransferase family 39 protein [Anaerolineae bacterium]|nr:glycosyltransferase family 39 protein [Anaerolineae bacterium]